MEEAKTKYYDELKDIACPFCGTVQSYEPGDNGDLTTYWGEESVEEKCWECGKTFLIQERVSRYWEVAKDINDF